MSTSCQRRPKHFATPEAGASSKQRGNIKPIALEMIEQGSKLCLVSTSILSRRFALGLVSVSAIGERTIFFALMADVEDLSEQAVDSDAV